MHWLVHSCSPHWSVPGQKAMAHFLPIDLQWHSPVLALPPGCERLPREQIGNCLFNLCPRVRCVTVVLIKTVANKTWKIHNEMNLSQKRSWINVRARNWIKHCILTGLYWMFWCFGLSSVKCQFISQSTYYATTDEPASLTRLNSPSEISACLSAEVHNQQVSEYSTDFCSCSVNSLILPCLIW